MGSPRQPALLLFALCGTTTLTSLTSSAAARPTTYKARIEVKTSSATHTESCAQLIAENKPCILQGVVFDDQDLDGHQQDGEPGVAHVRVSNGHDVVLTDAQGRYQLPIYEQPGGTSVFITKPAEYEVPVDQNNIPQFFYHHLPEGSPKLRFGGLAATGPLPAAVNFPLSYTGSKNHFKIVVSGDTQPYSNNEVGYVRDTLAKELSVTDDFELVIIEGDVMGDDLGLFPRFKQIMRLADKPVYLVPGNHDIDFDAPTDANSFDTFRREFGPPYYSLDIGKVHFVVLDDVKYPCTAEEDDQDGRHDFCDDPENTPTYTGAITPKQLQWLYNDLAHVPEDHLIVLNLHIPLVTYIDQEATKHQVTQVREIYQLLEGRPALAFSGHTHTLEQIRPGELYAGWQTAFSEPIGPSPFPQIVSGAACGSWWSGDLSDDGVPMSYGRLGAPRGYLVVEFDGNTYLDRWKATGKAETQQMSLSFLSPTFLAWYDKLSAWLNTDPELRSGTTPVSINDLPDPSIITATDMLGGTQLVANVWNSSRESRVWTRIDDREEVEMTRSQTGTGEGIATSLDPWALERQVYVLRYAIASESGDPRQQGFELYNGSRYEGDPQPLDESLLTTKSNHLWRAPLPTDLTQGAHKAVVRTIDMHGQEFSEVIAFEVLETRPAPLFRKEVFE
ncbi:MAG: calcineurin-like phosphoesterase family protein [Polyangiales bacterium]